MAAKRLLTHRYNGRQESTNQKRRGDISSDSAAMHGYWLFGTHTVMLALQNASRKTLRIAVTRNAEGRLTASYDASRHPVAEIMDNRALEKLLPAGAVHQGMAILVRPLPENMLDDILARADGPLVLLDQVTDPHNVGAILRSAAAFGATAVIVTKHHAPEETATLAKSASGALEIVPLVTVTNLVQAMEQTKKAGYWVAGLDGSAKQAIHEAKLGRKTALVMGAEGAGLRRLTTEHCDLLVKLPMSENMESLNVSNACAIALYELFRL